MAHLPQHGAHQVNHILPFRPPLVPSPMLCHMLFCVLSWPGYGSVRLSSSPSPLLLAQAAWPVVAPLQRRRVGHWPL